jgi:hydrogenase-4 component F
MATLAVTGTPPFSIFQSEFKILSAALSTGHDWMAFLFLLGIVTIFAGFLRHISKLTLGIPPAETRPAECRWKLSAMLLVAAPVAIIGFWLPGWLYELVRLSAHIIGGAP